MANDQVQEFARLFVDQVRGDRVVRFRMVRLVGEGPSSEGLLSVTVVVTEDFDETQCEQSAADMARLAVMGIAHERREEASCG